MNEECVGWTRHKKHDMTSRLAVRLVTLRGYRIDMSNSETDYPLRASPH